MIMSNASNAQKAPAAASEPATTEEALALIRAALGKVVKSVMVVSRVADGEISGVVFDDDEEGDYVSAQELVDDATYVVIGLGFLPTEQPSGVTVLE